MRLSREEKLLLAVRVRDAAVHLALCRGESINIQGTKGLSTILRTEHLEIVYSTPEALAPGAPAPYGLDVWVKGKGKVFSAWWDPFDLVRFDYGPWMNDFLPGSYVDTLSRQVH